MATLKGIFPEPIQRKNFIHENVKNVRKMEQFFHTNKEIEDLQKVHVQRQQRVPDKYRNVGPRVHSSLRENKHDDAFVNDLYAIKAEDDMDLLHHKSNIITVSNKSNKKISKLSKNVTETKQKSMERNKSTNKNEKNKQSKRPSESDISHRKLEERSNVKYRNQGIQTLDTKSLNDLYAEGVIRYPSCRSPQNNSLAPRVELNQDKTPKVWSNPPSDRGDVFPSLDLTQESEQKQSESLTPAEKVDYIKLNKQQTSVANKMANRLSNSIPPHYRKGVVPKYIRERKEAQQQKDELAKAAASLADCPEGHIPLPDNERKETLRMLKKNYQEFVNELNKMPIKTDTLKSQRRKMEIEKQLNKLEEGIKVFSRPKVYVKVNA
ncbi:uncharacterized protein LOC105703643 isoform X2 [Orussus abietinus]|uniref:uncharacterized protein LOC105703643 isoform X2 n=1 Tax=Orussus abietinus TaxID=222816 RepID=UPI0006250EBD|nr:uncharacterized protein LOC105703643 isoform X2 [Orussus abietinus]